jgi:hypothetical protein
MAGMGGWRGVAAAIAFAASVGGLLRFGGAQARPAGLDDPVARRSWAIGYSTGAGLRDVAPVSSDDFRRGLAEGLRGGASATRTLSRAERFALLRDTTARLAEARLEEIARRLDQEEDR